MAATKELIIDSFAGGGGASLGITWALGRGPDVAINHEPKAIAMHSVNHPETRHLTEDVFKSDPRKVTGGKPIGLLWASPDCTHHSRAKGGTPVKKEIRGLAWVVLKWAGTVKPRVIILENVREFEQWGPVCPLWRCGVCSWKGTAGQAKLGRRKRGTCPECGSMSVKATKDTIPNPAKKGVTFRVWVGRLKALGYKVEWKSLNAADYGAPTHRHRLFLVARRDGQPIVWPEPTHGDPATIGKDLFSQDQLPWRTAAECIDWSLPCPSIFMTREEARQWAKDRNCGTPQRPLKDNTLKRVATGVFRLVLNNPRPFLVPFVMVNTTGNPPTGAEEPLKTVTTGPHHYLVQPFVSRIGQTGGNGAYSNGVGEPVTTITSKAEHLLCSPLLVPVTHAGERRPNNPTEPLPTVTAANRGELALITPTLMPHYGGSVCASVESPCPTVTAGGMGKQVLISPVLVQTGYGEREGQAPRVLNIEAPLGTVVAGGAKHAVVAAFLAKHYGGVVGHEVDRPIGTVTAVDHHAVTVANLVTLNNNTGPSGPDEPTRTVAAGGNHAALVYSFLMKYHGNGGQWAAVNAPAPTADCKDRHALVTVTIDGQEYAIVDIGMRMLTPRELARAQGFPDDYILCPADLESARRHGNLTAMPPVTVKWGSKSDQVERIGNSVSPYPACAVVKANCADLAVKERVAA